MYKHIPKHILHSSIMQHHLIKHGFYDAPSSSKDNWYFDINKRIIVLEKT